MMIWDVYKLWRLHQQVQVVLARQTFSEVLQKFSLPMPAQMINPRRAKVQAEDAARWLRRLTRKRGTKACLDRSIALTYWLRQRGIAAEFKLGMAHNRTAHAWVEVASVPILEAHDVKLTHAEFKAERGDFF